MGLAVLLSTRPLQNMQASRNQDPTARVPTGGKKKVPT